MTSDKNECYTPAWIFEAMGIEFDLDVASPLSGPQHVPARRRFTIEDDGLVQPWEGLVWCNPPFSPYRPWAERWVRHDTGVLLGAYAPETAWTPTVMSAADCVALISAKFTRPDGTLLKPRHGLFVAFRGVGHRPAENLAKADRFGSVLYTKAPHDSLIGQ